MRRLLLLLMLPFLATLSTCTTRDEDEGKVILTYTRWGDPAEMESTRELIAQFERENPGIKVRVDVVSWGQYWQKIKTATVTHSAQDVWLMSPSYVEQYASAGHLLDLMPFIQADPSFRAEDYFEHAFDAFTFAGEGDDMRQVPFGQGKLYAFTRDYNLRLLFYNRDHFDALGLAYPDDSWTWEDLVAAAGKLTIDFDRDGVIDQWGYGGLGYLAFAHNIGAQPVDMQRRRSNYRSPLMLKSITFCRDLIYKYKVHPPPMIRIDETESFVTGKISMTVAGVWNIRSYNRSESRWDIARIPVDVKGRPHHAWAAGMGHCIYARTRHPEEAWKLVKFLSSSTGQRALARSGTSVPVLKSAAMSKDFLAPFDRPPRSSQRIIFESLSDSLSPGTSMKGYIEYTRKTSDILDNVWRDMLSPEKACEMVDQVTDAVLREQYGEAAP